MRAIFRSLLFVLLFTSGPAHSALTIEITQGIEGAVPIAVVPFGWGGPGAAPENLAAIISSDLSRSGRFEPLPDRAQIPEQRRASPDGGTWRKSPAPLPGRDAEPR